MPRIPRFSRTRGWREARALIVTVPDDTAATIIVAAAREQSNELPIVARAGTEQAAKRLASLGATRIVLPEHEGGVQVVRQALLLLNHPVREVHAYTEAIRRQMLDRPAVAFDQSRVFEQLLHAARDLEIAWVNVRPGSTLAGQSIAASGLRARTGASVVALARSGELMSNPDPAIRLEPGDHLAIIGSPDQVETVEGLAA